MKNLLFIPFIFLALLSRSQDWTTVTSGTTETLSKIHFINDSTGFILGDNGTLLKTSDGGNSWNTINTGVTHNLTTISFLNENEGYINGLRTIDGGNSWNVQLETSGFDVLIAFASNNLIGGNPTNLYQGEIHKSTDGGTTWSFVVDPITNGIYTDYYRVNDQTAYLATWYNGHLIKTEDAGSTWIENTTILSESGYIYGVSFPSDDIGIVASSSNGRIIKTTDGGVSWVSIFPSTGSDVFAAYGVFATSINDYVVVGRNTEATGNQKIYTTSDGGTSWTMSNSSTSNLNDVYCTSKNCYAVGENGTIVTRSNNVVNSTTDLENEQIKVFPNPTDDLLYIDSKEALDLTIFDLKGQLVLSSKTNQGNLDVSFLERGLYVLKISKNNQTVLTQEFLKN